MAALGRAETGIIVLFTQLQVVHCSEPEIYEAWWFWLAMAMFMGLFYASLKEGMDKVQCCCKNKKTAGAAAKTKHTVFPGKRPPPKINNGRPSHILTQVPFPWVPPPVKNTYHELNEKLPVPKKHQRSHSPYHTPRSQIQINVIEVDNGSAPHPLGVDIESPKKSNGLLSPHTCQAVRI